MPLYIKDDDTARLIAKLAQRTGMTKQDAAKNAIRAKLDAFSTKLTTPGVTARGAIPQRSTWAFASPMPARRAPARRCSTRATISL